MTEPSSPPPGATSTLTSTERLGNIFDSLYGAQRRERFRSWTVYLALGGLVLHVLLVFLARSLDAPPPLVAAVGENYLSALYTPFSFILFYEVLLLILSIPESTTRSLGRQYEILSLIVIRNVFKDIAEFESVSTLRQDLPEFTSVLLDMGGGLVMFVLVALFYHVNSKRPEREKPSADERAQLATFIARKKVIALLLSMLLFALAAFNLGVWGTEVVDVARARAVPTIDVKKIFYLDLFTVMIFADAVVLIFSLLLNDQYELVFRNAAFVVSTILLRFSLAVKKPYDVELGIASIAFGVLVVLIYNYFLRIQTPPPRAVLTPSEEPPP